MEPFKPFDSSLSNNDIENLSSQEKKVKELEKRNSDLKTSLNGQSKITIEKDILKNILDI